MHFLLDEKSKIRRSQRTKESRPKTTACPRRPNRLIYRTFLLKEKYQKFKAASIGPAHGCLNAWLSGRGVVSEETKRQASLRESQAFSQPLLALPRSAALPPRVVRNEAVTKLGVFLPHGPAGRRVGTSLLCRFASSPSREGAGGSPTPASRHCEARSSLVNKPNH